MFTYKENSKARQTYLKANKRHKLMVRTCQFSILFFFIAIWEVAGRLGMIDSFIMSMPSRILTTIQNHQSNELLMHIGVTFTETIIGFTLGITLGIGIAWLLWWSQFLGKVFDPYLVMLNALPKIALGPVIIIWVGAGMQAVIVMALAISLIVTIMEMLSGFKHTDTELIKMAKTLGANKWKTFVKIVFPYNLSTLFNCMKINIGLTLVGVIAGEFLVSRAGLGYLIIYGGQVFQMDLVMTSVMVLAVLAGLFYQGVVALEWITLHLFKGKEKR